MTDQELSAPIPRPTRLAEHIVERLTAMIMSGKLEAGEQIRQESLASQLGVSRTPLREALQRLEQEGLVAFSQSGVAHVASYDVDETMEMWDLREVVDGLAARVAAERGLSKQSERKLDRLVNQLENAHEQGDLLRYLDINTRFHLEMLESAEHRPLQQFGSLVRITSRAIFQRQTRIRSGSPHEHREILEAVRRRESEGAEARARAHIRHAATAWAESTERVSTQVPRVARGASSVGRRHSR